MSLATPLLREHVCTIIRVGWCHQRAQTPPAPLSMRSWKMLTPGLSLILLNCMEGIIVILRISGKAGTVIFLMLCRVCVSPLGKTLLYWSVWLGICCSALWHMPEFIKFRAFVLHFLIISLFINQGQFTPFFLWLKISFVEFTVELFLNGNIWLSYHTDPSSSMTSLWIVLKCFYLL